MANIFHDSGDPDIIIPRSIGQKKLQTTFYLVRNDTKKQDII